jgi:type IV pilus biogenesis protein CpaD/CtpE
VKHIIAVTATVALVLSACAGPDDRAAIKDSLTKRHFVVLGEPDVNNGKVVAQVSGYL